jgi:hypothetical protein
MIGAYEMADDQVAASVLSRRLSERVSGWTVASSGPKAQARTGAAIYACAQQTRAAGVSNVVLDCTDARCLCDLWSGH